MKFANSKHRRLTFGLAILLVFFGGRFLKNNFEFQRHKQDTIEKCFTKVKTGSDQVEMQPYRYSNFRLANADKTFDVFWTESRILRVGDQFDVQDEHFHTLYTIRGISPGQVVIHYDYDSVGPATAGHFSGVVTLQDNP